MLGGDVIKVQFFLVLLNELRGERSCFYVLSVLYRRTHMMAEQNFETIVKEENILAQQKLIRGKVVREQNSVVLRML